MKYYYMFLCLMTFSIFGESYKFYSQSGQDKYLYNTYFKNIKSGTFVELGAYDGISISNTYFFEKNLAWNGVCIEPMLEPYNKLIKNRKCICLNECVSNEIKMKDFFVIHVSEEQKKINQTAKNTEMLSGLMDKYDPRHLQTVNQYLKQFKGTSEIKKIETTTLQKIFNEHAINSVDLLCVDTEGSEFEILQGIDFSKTKIKVILVENNFNENNVKNLLEQNGFVFDRKLGCDDIFFNPVHIHK